MSMSMFVSTWRKQPPSSTQIVACNGSSSSNPRETDDRPVPVGWDTEGQGMASLESLPPSVRHRIFEYIADQSSLGVLPLVATVSREWQDAVEKYTFSHLHITPDRLADLERVVTRQRQVNVKTVKFSVSLDTYSRKRRNAGESIQEESNTTRFFTNCVRDLFDVLSRFNVPDASTDGIHLEISVESPSDETGSRSRSRRSSSPPTTRRARTSLVHLDLPKNSLPRLGTVTALICSGRHIELTSALLLVSKLPNLHLLDVELEHDTNEERDSVQRREFMLKLEHYAPNITDLRLRRPMYLLASNRAHSREARTLFYSLLLQYTQRCSSLMFDDCVDAREYFGPFRGDDPNSPAGNHIYWPRLQRLHIRNSYMLRRPYMRVTGRSTALRHVHEVLLLVGRAVRQMPALVSVRVRHYVLAENGLETMTLHYDVDGRRSRILVEGLQPSAPALEAWKESVQRIHGAEPWIHIKTAAPRARAEIPKDEV